MREKEIFGHVVSGGSNPQIAETLGISIKTVESHKHSLFVKLGVQSGADLIRQYAGRYGKKKPKKRRKKNQ